MAAALSHVPRDQWPDDVLTYQREQQRLKKRKDREKQIEDDRRRREVEQQRSREQLAKIAADEPEEQRRDPRLRAATKAASYKRQRQSEVDAANAVPADLMTDDEIEAAGTAPLTAPNEELKHHIVSRTRAALSDTNQGQRVCAVCDECASSRTNRASVRSVSRSRGHCSNTMFRRSSTSAT
jgi:membrane protein involved in colicin uptake